MENSAIYNELIKRANYALASKSRDLVYETYGAAKMARKLEAITNEQFFELNEMLVCNGLNNPKARLD